MPLQPAAPSPAMLLLLQTAIMHVSIDERLERLTERHEALTQTVEMMAARQAKIMEGLASLVRVAEIHEHGIERLEDAG
jgi:hypothetical protein